MLFPQNVFKCTQMFWDYLGSTFCDRDNLLNIDLVDHSAAQGPIQSLDQRSSQ